MREGFIMYKSFYEALSGLTDEQKGKCLSILSEYALYGKEPEIKDGVVKLFFTMAKPQIDANNKRFENGKKGGRPKNQIETKIKPKNNQEETKIKPKEKEKEKDNDNDKEEKKDIFLDEFDEFWKEFTPVKCNGRFVDKGSKKTAYEKYVKILEKGERHENIIRGVREYISHCQANNQLTCGATVFLNQERWKCDYGATIDGNSRTEHGESRSILETYAEIAREYK